MRLNYYWAAAIVILILVVYLLWRRRRAGRKQKGGRRGKRPAASGEPTSGPPSPAEHLTSAAEDPDEEDEPEDEETESAEGDERAQRLFRKVHRRMAAGLSPEEFQKLAGPDGGGFVYPMLLQLYNTAKQEGKDPVQSVTVRDYEAVLRDE